ncbi:MAG TPA: DUF4251 domain-containing protein [Puia sp.]|jgi:hypothetical protein|nr:DUF4251 domain-containing protein [Puia sp.]
MRYLLALLPLFFASTLTANAQTIKPLIDSQNYVFIAQIAQPLGTESRNLTYGTYNLKITKSKIVCSLPYYGRSRVASDPGTNPLEFTSNKFKYTVTPHKDGWKVSIKPRDAGDLDLLEIYVYPEGNANVQATFNGRDPIGFTGTVIAPTNP